ncbi:hypothetical protein [Flavobacterium sp. N2013]|nr:hypothetical protein [Flavobacterium sp. N2013]
MFVPVDEEGNVYVDYKAFNYAEGTTCVPYEGLFEIKANENAKVGSI